MSLNRKNRHALCALAAVAMTAVAFYADSQRAKSHQIDSALRWSRQVVSQTQGLVLYAKGKAYPDALGWAVGYLAQGVEPRILKVSKFLGTPGQKVETFEVEAESQALNYVRVLTPEDGMGVRLKIALDYVGFLGTQSLIASDLMLLFFFALSFALVYWVTGHQSGVVTNDARAGTVKDRVRRWAKDAKGALTQLGVHIREMVREAQNIAIAAGKSKNALGELRSKIHSSINELRKSQSSLKEGRAVATQAEVAALNLVLEASRMGESGRQMGLAAEELHRLMQKMRKTHQACESSVSKLEVDLEPWAIDADIAYHLFDDLFKSTKDMDQHIRSTTQSIIGHAKLIQTLGTEVNPEDATPVAKSRAQ